MAWIAYTTDGKEKSPIIKFLGDEVHAKIKEAMNVEAGDLVLFAADTFDIANAVLSALRLHMADALDIPRPGHKLLWVVDFPMFKFDEETNKYAAEHHPFTMIPEADWDKIETDPLACGATATTSLWTASKLAVAPSVFTTPSCRSAFLLVAA